MDDAVRVLRAVDSLVCVFCPHLRDGTLPAQQVSGGFAAAFACSIPCICYCVVLYRIVVTVFCILVRTYCCLTVRVDSNEGITFVSHL